MFRLSGHTRNYSLASLPLLKMHIFKFPIFSIFPVPGLQPAVPAQTHAVSEVLISLIFSSPDCEPERSSTEMKCSPRGSRAGPGVLSLSPRRSSASMPRAPLSLCWHLCLGAGDPSTHPAGLSPSCLHPVSPKISKGTSWRICRFGKCQGLAGTHKEL